MSDSIQIIDDLLKFYDKHGVAGMVNKDPNDDQCIWGAAIATGHAKGHGSYGTGLDPMVKTALLETATVPKGKK